MIITADQWRGDCIGCLKNSRHPVMTPHLNQLASEGVLFTQAYTDCPICMPQRVTTLTGQVASRFGLTSNFACRSPIENSLPAKLTEEANYQTKAIGKTHFHPSRARFGFEHITLHPNDYVNWLEEQGYGGLYRGHGLGGNEIYPATSAVPERYSHTHWIIDEAVKFLGQRDPDCPFFLWLIFEAPHSPFDPPEPYDRMYDNFKIPSPINGEWLNKKNSPVSIRNRQISQKNDYLSEEIILESRRRYYGQITHIDYQLGRFLGELKTRNLYDDTAIIFTSDHGEHLGDHGIFAKQTFLRGSGDVPLIMKFPKCSCLEITDSIIETPALTADIYPSILELASIKPESDIDGISWTNRIFNGNVVFDRTIHGECGNFAFAANKEFKYLYYMEDGAEQLFNMKEDPDNLHDLAGIPSFNGTMEYLRQSLIDYLNRFKRPMVKDGRLQVIGKSYDEKELRMRNGTAWRGPMRYGQGYHGYE